jgi:hypothetical protein
VSRVPTYARESYSTCEAISDCEETEPEAEKDRATRLRRSTNRPMAKAAHTTRAMMTVWPGIRLDGLDALVSPSTSGIITASPFPSSLRVGADEGETEGDSKVGAAVSASVSVPVDPPVIIGGVVLLIFGAGLGEERLVSLGSEEGGGNMGIDMGMDMGMDMDILM